MGLPEGTIGRILSFQALGTLLVAIPASALAARVRVKWLLIGSVLGGAIAFSSLVLLRHIPLLFPTACLAGACFAVHHVVAAPFFMRNSGREERLQLFGLNYAVEILSSVIGVAGGGWLARILAGELGSALLGLRYTLFASAILLAAAVIPYLLIHSPPPLPEERARARLWPIRIPRMIPRLLFPAALIGLGAGLVIPFLNLYFRDRFGQESDAIGRIFAVSQTLTALGFVSGPLLAKRFGMVRTAVGSELLSIPFFATLAFTQRLDVAVVAFWMRGALMNMNQPVSRNFAMEIVAPHEQAVTNALIESTWTAAWMVSTRVGGWFIERHGFEVPMLIAVVLYLVGSSSYFLFFRNAEVRLGIRGPARAPAPAEAVIAPETHE